MVVLAVFATLIPAHAGVILFMISASVMLLAYPRACGGDPLLNAAQTFYTTLSPRMRG